MMTKLAANVSTVALLTTILGNPADVQEYNGSIIVLWYGVTVDYSRISWVSPSMLTVHGPNVAFTFPVA